MKLIVLNRIQAENWFTDILHMMISISSPGGQQAELPMQMSRRFLLRLQFYDLTQRIKGYPRFSVKQARMIWKFVHTISAPILVIHCDAGISRSPAVAAAVDKYLTGEDERWFKEYIPNRYVYRKLIETMPKRVKETNESVTY